MAKVLMRVNGLDGQVELMGDRVVIHRAGLWNAFKFGFNARREIPLSAITEVAFRPGGKFALVQDVKDGSLLSGGIQLLPPRSRTSPWR